MLPMIALGMIISSFFLPRLIGIILVFLSVIMTLEWWWLNAK